MATRFIAAASNVNVEVLKFEWSWTIGLHLNVEILSNETVWFLWQGALIREWLYLFGIVDEVEVKEEHKRLLEVAQILQNQAAEEGPCE